MEGIEIFLFILLYCLGGIITFAVQISVRDENNMKKIASLSIIWPITWFVLIIKSFKYLSDLWKK